MKRQDRHPTHDKASFSQAEPDRTTFQGETGKKQPNDQQGRDYYRQAHKEGGGHTVLTIGLHR